MNHATFLGLVREFGRLLDTDRSRSWSVRKALDVKISAAKEKIIASQVDPAEIPQSNINTSYWLMSQWTLLLLLPIGRHGTRWYAVVTAAVALGPQGEQRGPMMVFYVFMSSSTLSSPRPFALRDRFDSKSTNNYRSFGYSM